ncbi:hypothetical protein YC2023_045815 [Brassica napus]
MWEEDRETKASNPNEVISDFLTLGCPNPADKSNNDVSSKQATSKTSRSHLTPISSNHSNLLHINILLGKDLRLAQDETFYKFELIASPNNIQNQLSSSAHKSEPLHALFIHSGQGRICTSEKVHPGELPFPKIDPPSTSSPPTNRDKPH